MFAIRLATSEDCSQILGIYKPVILETATSFEYDVPTEELFQARMDKIQRQFPWLVCTDHQTVAGYAYAGPHRSRRAYQWSTELSVYMHHQYQRKGIATALYRALIAALTLQGYYTALAGISLPNPASIQFHETLGFSHLGVYENIGFKFGRWHSVGWWQYPLRSYEPTPTDPASIATIEKTSEFSSVLETATNTLNHRK